MSASATPACCDRLGKVVANCAIGNADGAEGRAVDRDGSAAHVGNPVYETAVEVDALQVAKQLQFAIDFGTAEGVCPAGNDDALDIRFEAAVAVDLNAGFEVCLTNRLPNGALVGLSAKRLKRER